MKRIGIKNLLHRIADLLLLNSGFTDNPGLMNGKMGIAIFFYHYYRYSGYEIYNEFAGELLDQVYEEINTSTPADFENGLTGIGWGIEYLVRNKFVDADTDEALSEVDDTLYRRRLHSSILIDSSDSVFGYGHYYLSRLKGHPIDDNDLNTLIKKYHLIFLIDECERILLQKSYLKILNGPLSMDCLNSFMAFLLESHRLRIYPSKTGKLLKVLPAIIKEEGNRDQGQGLKLTTDLLSQFASSSKTDSGFSIEMANKDVWQRLIYGSLFNGKLTQEMDACKLHSIQKNEDEVNKMFEKVNRNNLGLNGLAGLGLLLALGTQSKVLCNQRGKVSESKSDG
jgi:hypothetical protein